MSCRTACGRVWASAPTSKRRKTARRRRNPGSRGGPCGRPRAGTSPAPTEHFGRAVPAAADLCRGRCPHRPAPTSKRRKIARWRQNTGSRGGLYGRPRAGTSPAPTEHFSRAVPAAADLCRGRCPHRPAPTSKRRKIARRRRAPEVGAAFMAARGRGQAPPLRSILAGRCLPQQTSVGADAHIGPHLRATGQLRAGVGTRSYVQAPQNSPPETSPGSRGGLYGRPRAGTSPAPTEHFSRAVPAAADLCRGRCPHRPAPPGHWPAPGGCGHPPLRPSAAE